MKIELKVIFLRNQKYKAIKYANKPPDKNMKGEINLPEYLRLIVDKTFQDNLATIIDFTENQFQTICKIDLWNL